MSIRNRRLLLLSSSALVLLCFAGIASSQTPAQETPPTTTTPETPQTPPTQVPAPQPQQGAPETPPTGAAPTVTVPQVTVEAPKPRPARRAAPAAPSRTAVRPAPRPAPPPAPATTPTTTPTTTTAGQPPASSFQPPPSLNTLNSNQIQASQAQSFGNLFFTLPGATSAGLAPGSSRPVLRGLDDFRVRVQENGVGVMDLSDYGQDHGVPIDPLSAQKIEIYRGPEALRFGSQAVGGVVEATNNRIPFATPPGGWQTQILGATTTVDRGLEGGALFDAGSHDFAFHADVYGRRANDYFIPSYPYLFPSDPAPAFNGKQPNSSFHSEGQSVGGSYLFDGGYVGAAISRFSTLYHVPTMEGAATNTRIALEQVKYTSKGEFRPQTSAIDVVRFWAGAVEYHHDELGIGDFGLDGIQATFNNHAQEARSEIQFMPMATPLGALISTVGAQFDHQQIDTSGAAGSLLGSARTNRGAAYLINELWFTDTLRTLLAGRIENLRLDGTAGIFPSALVPPPDNPALSLQALGFTPASISFKVLKDLPSWMVASATVQRIQRAPTALELFAHGAHDAPGTFEIGDPTLKIETANSAELGLRRWLGDFRFDGKVYYTYYNNFIFRQATGILCGESFATCGIDTEFIQTIYSQRDAIFRGGEIAWQWDLVPVATGIFGVDGQYDFVRATFASDGSNVPRMPPMRLGGGAYWRNDNWFVRMGLLHAFGQRDLGTNDTPTAGYNLLKMEISNKQYWRYSPWGPTEITTGLVGDNLLDVDVRNSVQFHKDEILLPGRSIKFFMNAKFGAEPPVQKASTGYYKGPTGYDAPMFYKAPIVTAWSWAGPYLGLNIGYSAGKSKTDAVFGDAALGAPLLATGSTENLNGLIGGAQAGYNWQAGNWVAGVEADIQMSGQGATPTYVCPGAVCNPTIVDFDAPVTASFIQGHKLDSFGTVRGRVGTTITPDVIAYATGGLAVGSIRTTVNLSGIGFDADGNPGVIGAPFSVLAIKPGWTVGAGLEGRLFGNVTGKVEYLYMDFGTVSTSVTNGLNATPIALATSSRITDNVVRAGVNYKFDPAIGGYDVLPSIGIPLIYKAPAYKAPPYAPIVTAWSWAGPYLGINVGYSAGKSKTDTVFSDTTAGSALFATGSSDNLNGVIAGFQGGYNWMASNWLVAGLEADIQLSTQNTTPTYVCPGAVCNPLIGDAAPVTASLDRAQKLDWFATVRGRLGATVTPNSMMYLTGGLALAEIKTAGTLSGSNLSFDENGNPTLTPVGVNFYDHRTKAGWTAGAGIEAHLGGNVTGKVEYLYLDFGRVSTAATNPLNATPVAVNLDSRVTDHIVRVGINYKFDPLATAYDAPLAANALALAKAPNVSAWSWTGPYLGVNYGYGWGKSNTDTVLSDASSGGALLATNMSPKLSGMTFGGQAGFNWQSGSWVAGIEADLQQSRQRGRAATLNCAGAVCNPAISAFGLDAPVSARMAQKLEWFGTLRGRLGVTPTPESLLYATGGLAIGRIKTSGTITGSSLTLTPGVIEGVTETTVTDFDEEGNPIEIPVEVPFEIPTITAGANPVTTSFVNYKTKAGFAVGAGAEVRLAGNWTGKVEYLYLDFGRVSTSGTNPLNSMPLAINFDSRVTNQIARVGLNYKFDPAGTVYETPTVSKGPTLYKAPIVTAWTWAGPYLGVNFGYGGGKSATDTLISDASSGAALMASSTSAELDGVNFGGQAGANWQFGPWVAGIEGDLQKSNQRGGTTTFNCAGAICNPSISALGLDAPVSARMTQKLEWFGTLRGRLGMTPTPESLLYATGGLAVGRIKTFGTISGTSLTLTPGVIEGVTETTTTGFDDEGNPIEIPVEVPFEIPTVSASTGPATSSFISHTTKAGFAVGAGAEVRLGGSWTGKVEYLYLDFGRVSTVAANPLNSSPLAINFDSRVTNHIARVGLNYKFDRTGAAYAASAAATSPMVFKAPVLAAWTWAGPYLGGTIGYSAGKSKTDTIFSDLASGAELFATSAQRRLDGAIGGAQAGYNWLAGIWLAGIEGDLNYSGQRAKLNAMCPGQICNPALVGVIGDPSVLARFEDGQKLEWFATLRGRLGVTVTPDAVAYVTGGLAVGEVMTAGTVFGFDGDGNPVNTIVSSHNTQAGWTVGGGIEGRLLGNWTAKIEYLYLDLGTVATIPAPAVNSTTAAAFNSRITDNLLRVGVNYKFDPNEIWAY
jgi:iron complex outermembrane receptor protein